jgi:hypothetical protein
MDLKTPMNSTADTVARSREAERTLRIPRERRSADLTREFVKALTDMRQTDWLELCELF